MAIFFDLDGTILHVAEKYNQTFNSLCKEFNLPQINYWTFRRNVDSFASASKLLGLDDAKQSEFRKAWESIIETEHALTFDELMEGSFELLLELNSYTTLILCTSRKNRKNLFWQLRQLKVLDLFQEVLNCPAEMKQAEIARWLEDNAETSNELLFVGDTEADMMASKACGLTGVGVLSGLSNKATLVKSGATIIINSVKDLRYIDLFNSRLSEFYK